MRLIQMFAFIVLTTVFLLVHSALALTTNVKVEIIGVTDFVIDGDTFDVIVNNGTEYRIRLADVNSNELGQPGYEEAKQYLITLVSGKTVYLDVDSFYLWDNHGAGDRLVCVPYIEFNSTHLMNICESLFITGHVEKRDYDNEFNPYSWSLYVPKEEAIPEFTDAGIIILLLIVISLTTIATSKRRQVNRTQRERPYRSKNVY